MSLSLGEKLRQAREERGISVSEVAEQTRISPQYIKAIENDDYKPLPGGIFNKGFVRSYARYVGFDENEALSDYAELTVANDVALEAEQKVYHAEVMTDDNSLRSFIPTIIFGAVILILVIGGIAFLVNYLINRPPSSPVANSSVPINNANINNSGSNAAPMPSGVPTMGTVRIEFSTSGEEVSLNSVLDGQVMNPTVFAGKPVLFEPKESLRVKYSKYRAPSVRMAINGKEIALPQSPANPKREPIEFDITRDNLEKIWDSGEIRFAPIAQTAATPRPTSRPGANANVAIPAARPSLAPVNPPMTRRTPQ